MKMHQYNPTAINVFFFLFSTSSSSCSSPQDSPIRPRGSLQAFMPATNGATARLTNTKISQTGERGRKERKKKGPCHHGFYHVGLLISVWKRGSNPLISLNAPVTPADNSIMIVAIKWDFPSRPADRGRGGAIIPLIFIRSTAFSIMTSGHLIQYTPTPVVLHACSHSTRHLYEANAKFALAKSCVVFIEGL